MPRLLSLLAARAGGLLNTAELSSSTGLPWHTLRRYLALLEKTFLVQLVPSWAGNIGKRLLKAPKLILADTGLMAWLVGVDEGRLAGERTPLGGLVECFVATELLKQATWSRTRPGLFHFRAQGGQEVDFILEDRRGCLVGIEVKSRAAVTAGDFKWLRSLRESMGARFVRGIALYNGRAAIPFGDRLDALPISALWRLGARPQGAGRVPGEGPAKAQEARRRFPAPRRRR